MSIKSWSKGSNLLVFAGILWFVINLIQAVVTPLHVDECYYYLFGQNLDWGYFDHPPGVAFLIYLSDRLAVGTLSVRLFTLVVHILTMAFIYLSVDVHQKKKPFFYISFALFCVALPLNNIYSFITTPDVPLLLTCSLFFLLYKEVVQETTNNLGIYCLWGVVMALMLYSKYHASLVIFFTLISNPKLLTNYKVYIAGVIGIVLFIPHLLWQYNNDFASFTYHLSERIVIYKNYFAIEYYGILLMIINPMFVGYLWKVIKNYKLAPFERALYFTLVGFILFFAWQSWRVQIQPQWLVIIYIPFIILFFNRFDPKYFKHIKLSILVILPLIVFARIVMAFDVLSNDLNLHRMKEYVEEIYQDAEDRTVVFYSSYKRASIFSWYKKEAFTTSFNGPKARKNQFNIWQRDSSLHHDEVYLVGVYTHTSEDKKYENDYYSNIREYRDIDNVKIDILNVKIENDSLKAKVEVTNPYRRMLSSPGTNLLAAYYFKNKRPITERHILTELEFEVLPKSSIVLDLVWPFPDDKDIDQVGIAINEFPWPYGPIYFRQDVGID